MPKQKEKRHKIRISQELYETIASAARQRGITVDEEAERRVRVVMHNLGLI